MLLLCLADQKTPCMDKLFFYVHQMDKTLERSVAKLNKVEENLAGKLQDFSKTLGKLEEDVKVTSDEGGSDEEFADEEDADNNEYDSLLLGGKVLLAWKGRRQALVSDWAIAGWLLCPIPQIYDDAKSYKAEHIRAMDRLIRKLMAPLLEQDEQKLGEFINDFWDEHRDFHSKKGNYDRPHIWYENNPDFLSQQSHVWHQKNSLRTTNALGKCTVNLVLSIMECSRMACCCI